MPGFTSLTQSLFSKVNERKASASLDRLTNTGESERGAPLRFQYWPESIQDTKTVNWAPRDVPGGSLPVYQWINSGERIISFTAVFSSDMDLIQGDDALVERLKAVGQEGRNVDIRAAAIWLREFMLPSAGELAGAETPISIAPARCLLRLPKSGIGVTGGVSGTSDVDAMVCIMTTCDLSYDAFFPSGLPRIMTASLAFAQIPQLGSSVIFPAQTEMAADGGGVDKSFGYKLTVTGRG